MNQSLPEVLRAAADEGAVAHAITGRELLLRGRRRRTRRRALASLAGVGVAGCATVMAGLLMPSEAGSQVIAAADIRATHMPGANKILADCAKTSVEDIRDEEQRTEPTLFGPKAAVITAAVTKQGTAAFILGTNRKFYAECHLQPQAGPGSWLHEYKVTAAPGGGQNTLYLGRRTFTYTDRFPPEVAKVRIDLYGGGTVTANTVDGFVAFKQAGEPARITLIDADGNVLAQGEWETLPPEYDSLLPSQRR